MSDAAVATIVTGLVTITTLVCGVLTIWLKLGKAEHKIDENTEVTKAGTSAAQYNAIAAKDAAKLAASKAEELVKYLNGDLDTKIRTIVKEHFDPLSIAIMMHAEQDDKNMKEIRQALGELRDQIKGSVR